MMPTIGFEAAGASFAVDSDSPSPPPACSCGFSVNSSPGIGSVSQKYARYINNTLAEPTKLLEPKDVALSIYSKRAKHVDKNEILNTKMHGSEFE